MFLGLIFTLPSNLSHFLLEIDFVDFFYKFKIKKSNYEILCYCSRLNLKALHKIIFFDNCMYLKELYIINFLIF